MLNLYFTTQKRDTKTTVQTYKAKGKNPRN